MVFIATIPALVFVLWIVSEYRFRRWMRLTLGIGSVVSGVAVTLLVAWLQRIELAGRYRTATADLAYSVEAAIHKNRAEEAASKLNLFRYAGTFDLGAPPDYYQTIERVAQEINSLDQAGR